MGWGDILKDGLGILVEKGKEELKSITAPETEEERRKNNILRNCTCVHRDGKFGQCIDYENIFCYSCPEGRSCPKKDNFYVTSEAVKPEFIPYISAKAHYKKLGIDDPEKTIATALVKKYYPNLEAATYVIDSVLTSGISIMQYAQWDIIDAFSKHYTDISDEDARRLFILIIAVTKYCETLYGISFLLQCKMYFYSDMDDFLYMLKFAMMFFRLKNPLTQEYTEFDQEHMSMFKDPSKLDVTMLGYKTDDGEKFRPIRKGEQEGVSVEELWEQIEKENVADKDAYHDAMLEYDEFLKSLI